MGAPNRGEMPPRGARRNPPRKTPSPMIRISCAAASSTYALEVRAGDTILSVKQKLAAQEGLPKPERQRLIFSSRVLRHDQQYLRDAGIRDGDSLVLELVSDAPAPAWLTSAVLHNADLAVVVLSFLDAHSLLAAKLV